MLFYGSGDGCDVLSYILEGRVCIWLVVSVFVDILGG